MKAQEGGGGGGGVGSGSGSGSGAAGSAGSCFVEPAFDPPLREKPGELARFEEVKEIILTLEGKHGGDNFILMFMGSVKKEKSTRVVAHGPNSDYVNFNTELISLCGITMTAIAAFVAAGVPTYTYKIDYDDKPAWYTTMVNGENGENGKNGGSDAITTDWNNKGQFPGSYFKGKWVTDSVIILQELEKSFPSAYSRISQDIKDEAIKKISESNVFFGLIPYLKSEEEGTIERLNEEMFGVLEGYFARTGFDWIAGNSLSIHDVKFGCFVCMANFIVLYFAGRSLVDRQHERVWRWIGRLADSDCYRRSMEYTRVPPSRYVAKLLSQFEKFGWDLRPAAMAPIESQDFPLDAHSRFYELDKVTTEASAAGKAGTVSDALIALKAQEGGGGGGGVGSGGDGGNGVAGNGLNVENAADATGHLREEKEHVEGKCRVEKIQSSVVDAAVMVTHGKGGKTRKLDSHSSPQDESTVLLDTSPSDDSINSPERVAARNRWKKLRSSIKAAKKIQLASKPARIHMIDEDEGEEASKKKPKYFSRRGRPKIDKESLKSRQKRSADVNWGKNWYWMLLDASWMQLGGVVTVIYTFIALIFAIITTLFFDELSGTDNEDVSGLGRFEMSMMFVITNLVSIGLGTFEPSGRATQVITILTYFIGLIINVLLFSIVVTKFQRPQAEIVFSEVALFTSRNETPFFVFRLGNMRGNLLYFPKVEITVQTPIVTIEGEEMMKMQPIMTYTTPSTLTGSITFAHLIDEDSPLKFITSLQKFEALDADEMIFSVAFSAFDSTFHSEIVSSKKYFVRDLAFGVRFADIMETKGGFSFVNWDRFNVLVPIPSLSVAKAYRSLLLLNKNPRKIKGKTEEIEGGVDDGKSR